jgi:hypothetical protein
MVISMISSKDTSMMNSSTLGLKERVAAWLVSRSVKVKKHENPCDESYPKDPC